ncbi:hypothetical protein [Legionella bononiensis]|uniref:Cthe-2314-like HEPN domain-containing protein n=1 Tax=Legionella bononiensis TaxID=2793102 RepID=A0ABS1WDY5_9GAMM|nr:hypothetical protein [Legionella bononiensis]MBL7479573.1 hypothetical protein [Legionella bononiensis]MBL7527552.1 hypothetical protein [Legionella bononiensis]
MTDAKQLIEEIGKAFKDNSLTLLTTAANFKEWLNGVFFESNTELKSYLNDKIKCKCTEIFWSIANIQISIGDFILIDEGSELSDMLILHRLYIVYEQFYRAWERYTSLLAYLFLKMEEKRNFYFNNLVDELKLLKEIEHNKELAKYSHKWNSLAKERNTFSHKASSLSEKWSHIDFELSPIVDQKGNKIVYTKVNRINKDSYLKKIKNHLEDIEDINKQVRDFINSNKKNIFKFQTSFPWKCLSLKQPKGGEKYLVYKLEQYHLLDKNEFQSDSVIKIPTEYIFWKDIEPPPNGAD